MRPPRFRLRTLMSLVALTAVLLTIDSAWLRTISLGHSAFGFKQSGLDYGALPMANALALALFLIGVGRARDRPFLVGFVACGLAAASAYVACGLMALGTVLHFHSKVFALYFWSHLPVTYPGRVVCFAGADALPQLLFALLGGLLARWASRSGPRRVAIIKRIG